MPDTNPALSTGRQAFITMRIVYFGTPAFSAAFLQALLGDSFFDVVGLVCQPDEPVGRKKILTAPATKELFQKIHPDRPVFQPTKLRPPEFAEELKKLHADAFVIVAYGRIIPQHILDVPKFGNVNVHPSLLPTWRGPSPMQAAIAAGDTQTGVTIMLLDADMDHGPILAQETFSLAKNETLASLTDRVVSTGAPLLSSELKKLTSGTSAPHEQNHAKATFCTLLKKENGLVSSEKSAEEIERLVRAFNPWPGVRTIFTLASGETQEVKLHDVRLTEKLLKQGDVAIENNQLFLGTSSGALEVRSLQPATKNTLTTKAYLQGYKPMRF